MTPPDAAAAFWQAGGFALYVHWPFCAAKCPYCDFNSHVRVRIDQKVWAEALLQELDRVASLVPGRTLRSIFFGGGTPSLMAPETVGALIARAGKHWHMPDDAEITLEANPTSVEAGRFAGYAAAGVNRVSIGVQALSDADLVRLGRLHDVRQALEAIEIARQCFARVSFDLIYARQDQGAAAWEAELGRALALGPDHLSLYQLTIEPGTVFAERAARGRLSGLPGGELSADLYEMTQEICRAAGLPAYEISNHARQGQESRHNMVYWQGGDYAGIGPGAHGRLSLSGAIHATEAHANPELWLEAVKVRGSGMALEAPLDPAERAAEYLMMGLRLTGGVEVKRVEMLSTATIDWPGVRRMEESGFLQAVDGQLALTETGRPLLNRILQEIMRSGSAGE